MKKLYLILILPPMVVIGIFKGAADQLGADFVDWRHAWRNS